MVLTKINFAMYLCTREAGILSATIIHCPINIIGELTLHLNALTGHLLRCAQDGEPVQTYATAEVSIKLQSDCSLVLTSPVSYVGTVSPSLPAHRPPEG